MPVVFVVDDEAQVLVMAKSILQESGYQTVTASSQPKRRNRIAAVHASGYDRFCSLIPGQGVKLSATILAGPTVLSAVGASPPHDGVRRRWWINVASAVSLVESSQKIGRSHHRHRPGRDSLFPRYRRNP